MQEKKRAQIKRSSGVAWSHELRAAIVAKTFPLPKKASRSLLIIAIATFSRNILKLPYRTRKDMPKREIEEEEVAPVECGGGRGGRGGSRGRGGGRRTPSGANRGRHPLRGNKTDLLEQ